MKIVFPTNESFELTEELISSIFKDRRKSWSLTKINLEYFKDIFKRFSVDNEIIEISSIKKVMKEIELMEWRWNNDRAKVQPYYTREDVSIIEELLESLPANENLLRIEQKKQNAERLNKFIQDTIAKHSMFSSTGKVDVLSSSGRTSPEEKLYDLCWYDDTEKEVIKLLSENAIDINRQFSLDDTCLMRASRKGHFNLVRILLENHANRDLLDVSRKTASYYAVSKEIKDLIDNWPVEKSHQTKCRK